MNGASNFFSTASSTSTVLLSFCTYCKWVRLTSDLISVFAYCSRGYSTGSDEPESEADTEDLIHQLKPSQPRNEGQSMKKPVELDKNGEPFGAMKVPFANDIKKYARDLDPRMGWEGQPIQDRRRLFRRLYSGT